MVMARRCVPLSVDSLDLLASACRSCVRWELDPLEASRARRGGDATTAKREWWRAALVAGDAGGVLARVDGRAVGYATWSRPERAGGGVATPTAPVSPDAVLLLALRVDPEHRGVGLGRWLVHEVVRQSLRPAARHGEPRPLARALEAYGDQRADGETPGCLVPVGFWVACGFEVVRDHPTTPRLRLDARRLASWRDVRSDVGEAWVRLRGAVRPDPAPEPAGRVS